MLRVYDNILETAGSTPLVRLGRINTTGANVFAKVESRNPGGSTKDRVAIAMVEAAERRGELKPGAVIVEPTSGNTGIGLAVVAAIRGYRLVLTMPDTMSVERRRLLAAYGAELVLTDGKLGMSAAIEKANAIVASTPGAWMPRQFDNPDNPIAHEEGTGPEIAEALGNQVAAFVAGVGTGGTLTGTARALRKTCSDVRIVAVEPADSPLLSKGYSGPHNLQGIGANFIPSVLDMSLVDEIVTVSDDQAAKYARLAATKEGMLVGITGGAALHAAMLLAARPEFNGKNIVALIPDSGERYLSGWLFEN
ncbi:MAG: cysteine synthase A [Victivallaceae bacterium]|nr:cysteine synthase A [Victivallaceae bacterium]